MTTKVPKPSPFAAPTHTEYALKHMLTREYFGNSAQYEPDDASARTWPSMTAEVLFLDTNPYLPERHRWNVVPVRRAGEAPAS